MYKIIEQLLSNIGSAIGPILIKICDTLKSCFSFLDKYQEQKIIKEQKKEQQEQKKQELEHQKKIEEVVDHGTLDDLLDLKAKDK